MFLVAQNNFQLIIEFAILLNIIIILFLNIVPLTLSIVLLFALIISVVLALLFGFDSLLLISNLKSHEFTHPYGAIAILSIVTCIAAICMMDNEGFNPKSLKIFTLLLIILITLVGGTVHRDFLGMWIFGLLVGFLILSKSFRRKSVLTFKRIISVIIVSLVAFGFFQILSTILNLPIISPLLRLSRLDQNSVSSIKMVIQNTYLIGHNPASAYLANSIGFVDGYIALPLTVITHLNLPFPEFYGILSNRQDVINYFVPGILGYSYDFGYIIMFIFIAYVIGVLLIGFKILEIYRRNRENGGKSLLGREALLIGSITAFASQAWIRFFIITRFINGTSLVTFLFLGAIILGHLFIINKK
ncbi:MAG: hypothetical protein ACLQG5_08300 [Methanobacterium sp.]|jgi:hypothetical protein